MVLGWGFPLHGRRGEKLAGRPRGLAHGVGELTIAVIEDIGEFSEELGRQKGSVSELEYESPVSRVPKIIDGHNLQWRFCGKPGYLPFSWLRLTLFNSVRRV